MGFFGRWVVAALVVAGCSGTPSTSVIDAGSADVPMTLDAISVADGAGPGPGDATVTACVPDCLSAMFAACPPVGMCQSTLLGDGMSLRLCYPDGVKVTRGNAQDDAGMSGLEGVATKNGADCFRWRRTKGAPETTIVFTLPDASTITLVSAASDGGAVNSVTCGGSTTVLDSNKLGCFDYLYDRTLFIGGPCPTGTCEP